MSLFYCSDINVLLVDYSQWELYNIWLLLVEDNSASITIQEKHWRNSIVAVITSGWMIDDNLTSQIKNRTLHTCRLFPLLPTLFLRYTKGNKFKKFSKIGLMLISHSWYSFNFESAYKKSFFIKVAVFF